MTSSEVQFRAQVVTELSEENAAFRGKPRRITFVESICDAGSPDASNIRLSWRDVGEEMPLGVSFTGDPAFMLRVAEVWQQHSGADSMKVLLDVPFIAAHLAHAILRRLPAGDVSTLASEASGCAPGDPGHGRLVLWLMTHVSKILEAAGMPPATPEEASQDARGAVFLDRALASVVRKTGKQGASTAKKISAPPSTEPWARWRRERGASSKVPALRWLARVGWLDVVKPRMDREAEDQRKRDAPFRFPQPVGHGMTASRATTIKSRRRAADGLWTSWTSCVTLAIPGAQLALPLPMDVEVDAGGTLQSVLTGGLLRTYLATWALWADKRSLLVDGGFAWDEEAVIRQYLKKTGKISGHLRAEVRADLARLCEFRVVKAGGWSVENGSEPLIRAYRADSSGQVVYKHAGVITLFLNQNFAQVPRNVLSLAPDDVPLALGLTTVTRILASDMLAKGNRHEGTLQQLADACGVDVGGGLRKYGPAAFWTRTLASLKRVASDGQVGIIEQIDGDAATGEVRVRLTMSDEMAAAYRPLLARVAQRRAAEMAASARGLGRPGKAKGKPAPPG